MARRYLFVKIVCDRKLTNEQFHETMDKAAKRYFGELGISRIDPRIMKFDVDSSTAILSCERGAISEFESALTLITGSPEASISVLVLRVSGTIKGAAKAAK